MRIAFVVRRFPDLSETFILNQITGLLDLGHDVEIFATLPRADGKTHPDVEAYGLLARTRYLQVRRNLLLRAGEGVVRLLAGLFLNPVPTLRSLALWRFGREAASLRLLHMAAAFRGKYDLVHCHFGVLGEIGLTLRELGVRFGPLVTSFHGFDVTTALKAGGRGIYDQLFRRGDLFLPISENWKRLLVRLGCPEERIRVVHMGVDCSRFAFAPRRLGRGEPARLLSVARLVEKKGLEYAIRAVAALAGRGYDLRYTIIGDGQLAAELRALAEELEVAEIVSFAGSMPQDLVRRHLERSHLLLAPSVTAANGDQEGIPVVIMEAMATGMPVVSTFHSGIPELVADGRTGALVPERDVDALIEAVGRLLDAPESWVELGRRARARVEADFNNQTQVSRLEHVYREACGKSSP